MSDFDTRQDLNINITIDDGKDFDLDQLIFTYPDVDNKNLQNIITSKQEFRQLIAAPWEDVPKRGQYYTHQKIIHRYMRFNDVLLVMWRAGTGKTGAFAGLGQQLKYEWLERQSNTSLADNYAKRYLEGKFTNIEKVYLLTKPILIDEFKNQLVTNFSKPGEYDLTDVNKATKESNRKAALTRLINKEGFYHIMTYEGFLKEVGEGIGSEYKLYNEGTIREKLSGTLFIIDEAHNIEVDERSPETMGPKQKILETLGYVFNLVDRRKIMLMTATPMVNSSNDLKDLLNLILPPDNKIEANLNFETMSAQELSTYFNGRISFVREFESQANPRYISNPEVKITPSIIDNKGNKSERIIYGDRMMTGTAYDIDDDGNKTIVYGQDTKLEKSISEKKDTAFLKTQKQLSVIAWPGEEILSAKQTQGFFTKGNPKYPNPLIKRWLLDEIPTGDKKKYYQGLPDGVTPLRFISSKIPTIIRNARDKPGNTFVYTEHVVSGILPLVAAALINGFELFDSSSPVIVNSNLNVLPLKSEKEEKIDEIEWEEIEELEIGDEDKGPIKATSKGKLELDVDVMVNKEIKEIKEDKKVGRKVLLPLSKVLIREPSLIFGQFREFYREGSNAKPRIAYLSSNNKQNHGVILSTFNSWENRHGEIIKILVTSGVGREGINTANTTNIYTMGAEWNEANIYQALQRAIRATSHEDLLNEIRAAWSISKGEMAEMSLDNIKVDINIYLMAALRARADPKIKSTDEYIYDFSENKDREIKPVERKLKINAIDCQLNKNRNMRIEGYREFSAECDYLPCYYECLNEPPDSVDFTSFESIYLFEILEIIIEQTTKYFTFYTSGHVDHIANYIMSHSYDILRQKIGYEVIPRLRRYVIYAVYHVALKELIVLNDRFGRKSYLNISDDIIYISECYYHYNNYITDIDNYLKVNMYHLYENDYKIKKISFGSEEKLINKEIVDLIGMNDIRGYNSQMMINNIEYNLSNIEVQNDNVILSFYDEVKINNYIINENIIKKLFDSGMRASQRVKLIENSIIGTNDKRIDDLIKSYYNNRIFRININNKDVTLHGILMDTFRSSSIVPFLKGDFEKLRILDNNPPKWRDANLNEMKEYLPIIKQIIENRNKEIEVRSNRFNNYYGTVSLDNNIFRIHSLSGGARDCINYNKDGMADILYQIGFPIQIDQYTDNMSREDLISDIVPRKIKLDLANKWELDRLKYYRQALVEIDRVKKKQICPLILDYMARNDILMYI